MGFTELGLASVLELDHLLSNMLGLSPATVDRVEPSDFRPYFEYTSVYRTVYKRNFP